MRKLWFIPAIAALVAAFFLIIAYQKSGTLETKGDFLARQNKYQEALLYYLEAQGIFPWKASINDNINAVQLLVNSQNEYEEITGTEFAEVQNLPGINNIPTYTISKNEYFVPILMYHHIRINPKPNNPVWESLNVKPTDLENELNYLSTHNYHTISLDDLYDAMVNQKSLPQNPIILSFDDGYKNFYENAFPLLKKYKMKATEFVITQVETAPAYLSWDQILELDRSGLIEIGAHTQHHPYLTDLTATSINNEIEGSKKDIEMHTGHPIHWFAYPYGVYNNYIISEVQKLGFLGAVSTNYSPVQNKEKLFVMPRIMVDGRFTLDEFATRIKK